MHRLDVVGPQEAVAVEGVVNGVVGGDGEGNAVGGLGAREGEAAAAGVGGVVDRVEVEVDVAVEVVEVDAAIAIEFGDFKVRVRR